MSTHELSVPGAVLHYELRGSGPLLVLVGTPMGAGEFQQLADAMADDHTVITLDPRGYGDSTIDDADQPSTVDLRARDVIAILDDRGADTADVFGSSGGAVTGLALMTGWPQRVRTLIAHEPPLSQLLPDRDDQLLRGWEVRDELDHQLDAVIDGESGYTPTTVVDVTSGVPEIIRVGAGDPTPFE